ncbi:MAG: response regulator [Lewinellaceae bacterium]|nr:response regulator [Lewinellaceae bacterium]
MMNKFPAMLLACLLVVSLFSQSGSLDSLKQALVAANQDTHKVNLLNQLSAAYRSVDPVQCRDFAQQAVRLSERLEFSRGLSRACYNLAAGYYYSGQFDSVYTMAERAVELGQESNDFILLNSAYGLMASAAFDEGDYERAVANNMKALEVAEANGDLEGVAFSSNTLGNVQWKLQNFERARYYYQQALDGFEELGNSYGMANALSNLGNVAPSDSLRMAYHLQARDMYEQMGNIYGIATMDNNIGSFFHNHQQYKKAIEYYRAALELLEGTDFKEKLVQVYTNLGSAYGEMGQLELALPWFEKAVALAEREGITSLLKDTYEYMSNAYSQKQDYANAFKYLKLFRNLQDSLFHEELALKVADSEDKIRSSEQGRELAQKELELSLQRASRNRILYISLLLILALSALALWARSRASLRKQQAELQRAEADKLRELDRIKSSFFANISHEFRTPLTLIKGPLQDMAHGRFKGDLQKYYRIMLRNSERLLNLVNQLLDLSKLEGGRMRLNLELGDAGQFIRAIAHSFESMGERKQIQYDITVSEALSQAWFDRDKLEKLLSNLLSNAFKFTAEEGWIELKADTVEQGRFLRLLVQDNGIGIPSEQLPRIFERFYSPPQPPRRERVRDGGGMGSGIGLALTKELVELHGGRIEVESKEGKGTTFTVWLPIQKDLFPANAEVNIDPADDVDAIDAIDSMDATVSIASAPKERVSTGPLKEVILVVEDNADVRQYIVGQLSSHYRVLEAAEGRTGLELASREVPGLILTDVMMPEMDGVELCRHLRAQAATSHIPIVMLTAKADRENKLEGLETGADDYLVKPFDAEELRLRVGNLLEQRRRWRERFSKEVSFRPAEVAITSVEEAFLNRVVAMVEQNMDDETFGVPELADAVGLSRSQLHRKLKALSGKSPSEVIRDMRLQRASDLLQKGAGNASEVAFMVGFNSLAYFSKCFKDAFGYPPSAVGLH